MYICIAGKNECAVNALSHLIQLKFQKSKILVLPNNNDKGIDSWQPSLRKFAKRRAKSAQISQVPPGFGKLHWENLLIYPNG